MEMKNITTVVAELQGIGGQIYDWRINRGIREDSITIFIPLNKREAMPIITLNNCFTPDGKIMIDRDYVVRQTVEFVKQLKDEN
jgi:hypothetical protein